jgi:23S rRNA (adenine2030-N6)-methyltransferase
MLSYRHGFHAGNPADVLKHMVLVFCLEYLTQKEKPLLCADTHAGAGLYSLEDGFAAQKREWESGIGKLLKIHNSAAAGGMADTKTPAMLDRYLQLCATDMPAAYPGSPLIMARLLQARGRLVCFELHPADHAACKALLGKQAEVRQEDGFAGLKGLLPPPSRRGLVLIDPPYEVKEDYTRVPESLTTALRRFPSGVYIVWYPLLRKSPETAAGDLPARLMELCGENRPLPRCRVELYTAGPDAPPANSPRGMYGSGLVIYNPPWTLKAALEESLPVLGAEIGIGKNCWKIEGFFH